MEQFEQIFDPRLPLDLLQLRLQPVQPGEVLAAGEGEGHEVGVLAGGGVLGKEGKEEHVCLSVLLKLPGQLLKSEKKYPYPRCLPPCLIVYVQQQLIFPVVAAAATFVMVYHELQLQKIYFFRHCRLLTSARSM